MISHFSLLYKSRIRGCFSEKPTPTLNPPQLSYANGGLIAFDGSSERIRHQRGCSPHRSGSSRLQVPLVSRPIALAPSSRSARRSASAKDQTLPDGFELRTNETTRKLSPRAICLPTKRRAVPAAVSSDIIGGYFWTPTTRRPRLLLL